MLPFPVDMDSWSPRCPGTTQQQIISALESGTVILFPRLAFFLAGAETRFLSPGWSDGKAKNLSFENSSTGLRGARGAPENLDALQAMIQRFARQATSLAESLLPQYRAGMRVARASFRPAKVESRKSSPRKDDGRLHVDAFPSRPTCGARILRLFCNVNPGGEPRVWRIGEPFEPFAARFLKHIPRALPGTASLLAALRLTKGRRSEYDFMMLRLHDMAKLDESFQRHSPQITFPFPAPCAWLAFTDQVLHAAMSGQYLLEQTFHIPLASMLDEFKSPLRTLERLTGRKLVS